MGGDAGRHGRRRRVSLALAHIEHPAQGPESGPPLVIAHGLFGSARNFNALGKRFAARRRVIALDMRNHGASPWDADCSYPAMAGDLAAAVDRLAGGRAVVLGHSMGGKAAMALALSAPDRVAGLIVADIAPMAYAHSHDPYIDAMQAVDLARVTRRADADPMLADAVPEPALRAFLLQNLVVEGGTARWRINLAALGRGMADLTGWPEDWPHPRFDGPTLVLRGGRSDYAGADAEPAIRARFPTARIETLEDAGHWLHAEAPDAFAARVSAWIERI